MLVKCPSPQICRKVMSLELIKKRSVFFFVLYHEISQELLNHWCIEKSDMPQRLMVRPVYFYHINNSQNLESA